MASDRIFCPNDSMWIPKVADVEEGDGRVSYSFYWCWSCMELFAFTEPAHLLSVRLASNGAGGWRIFEALCDEDAVQRCMKAAASVRPQFDEWNALASKIRRRT